MGHTHLLRNITHARLAIFAYCACAYYVLMRAARRVDSIASHGEPKLASLVNLPRNCDGLNYEMVTLTLASLYILGHYCYFPSTGTPPGQGPHFRDCPGHSGMVGNYACSPRVKLSLTATFVVVCDCLFAVGSLNEYAVR